MNWKQRLFKPKWQHKDADTRLRAGSSEQDPQLISKLVEIAGQDTDSRVRCAAIKRLHRLENILKLHASENQAEVRSLLEDRIRQLASSSAADRPALELRMQVVESTKDRDLIEHIAGHAPEASLRRAALAKVNRQGVLGDCCLNDIDAENRQFAAARITQHTTLKRVIGGLRKRDKTLYVQLQNRLHEELLANADPVAVQSEALKVCSSLEHHAIEIATAADGEIADLHKTWQKIADSVTPEMSERYQRVCHRLAAPDEPVAPAVAPAKVETPEPTPAATPSPEIPPESNAPAQPNDALAQAATDICLYDVENPERPKPVSIKKLRHKLEIAWKQCRPPHPEDQANWDEANVAIEHMESTLENLRQQAESELAQAETLLTQLAQELEDGELHKALETRASLQKLNKAKSAGAHGAWKRINGKLSGMQPRLRELREWQHWSNNKIRKRLIAEMEVLPAADLHPDALLDRIKSLQTEWKALEQSEQIPGEKHFSAAPWMWRKFSAAGHTAFDTAKPFLDKRSEIQSRHAQSLATFCAELEQLAEAEPRDWTALGKAMNRGRKKLRDLNSIPAKQRQSFARKLKSALDKANQVMQDHYEVVEKEKMKLIRAASQLIHLPERSEAITEAKGLQSQWKAAGSLWRSKEQQLWNQFREHLDPLFEELKEQQATIRAADEERLAAQKALCKELKDILSNKDDLAAQHGRVQGLRDSWKDIQHPDRRLLDSFQAMVAEYDQREVDAQKQQVKADSERWWLKSALLQELAVSGRTTKGAISKGTETRVNKTWPEESSSDPLETALDQACQDYLSGELGVADEAHQEELREQSHLLCIRLEFVAGLQSPEEDREQRMQYQVDRLAESLSGESARLPALEEAREAEKIWLQMYALPETDYKAFGERIQKALSAITES
jgi:hypothetical protein